MSGFYKVPLDEATDKDIIDWIAQYPRNKKGEIVRHAIRYYMQEQQRQGGIYIINTDGTTQTASQAVSVESSSPVVDSNTPKVESVERKKPRLNIGNLK